MPNTYSMLKYLSTSYLGTGSWVTGLLLRQTILQWSKAIWPIPRQRLALIGESPGLFARAGTAITKQSCLSAQERLSSSHICQDGGERSSRCAYCAPLVLQAPLELLILICWGRLACPRANGATVFGCYSAPTAPSKSESFQRAGEAALRAGLLMMQTGRSPARNFHGQGVLSAGKWQNAFDGIDFERQT